MAQEGGGSRLHGQQELPPLCLWLLMRFGNKREGISARLVLLRPPFLVGCFHPGEVAQLQLESVPG